MMLLATFSRQRREVRLFARFVGYDAARGVAACITMDAKPPVELSREVTSIRNMCRVHRHRH